MLLTEVQIHSYSVITATDVQEFRFEATVLAPGELPHTSIFVFTIVDEDDPSSDLFVRVATTTDIDNLLIERDAAISAEQSEYLSSFLYRQYPAVDTAINAKDSLKSRINDLCNDWVQYRDTFIVDDEEVSLYPNSLPSLEEARLDDYTTAKNNRKTADLNLAEKDSVVTSAEDTLNNSREIYAARKDADDFTQDLTTKFNTYYLLITTEGTEATIYRTGTLWPLIESETNSNTAKKASAANTVSANEIALADASIDRSVAAAELSVALAAENEALAALLEVCPTFDPSTV